MIKTTNESTDYLIQRNSFLISRKTPNLQTFDITGLKVLKA